MDRDWVDHLKAEGAAFRWPVRTTLWLLIAIILLTGWTAVARQVRFERQEAERGAILQAQNRSIALEQYVARTMEAADLVTRHLGYRYFIRRDLPPEAASGARPALIDDPVVNRAIFAGAHVVAPDGDIIATTLRLRGRTNVAGHPVFKDDLATTSDRLQVSRPLPATAIAGSYVHASRRITDPSGRLLGLVDLQIAPAQLISFPQYATFKPTDLVSVISLEGITLARREGDRVSSGEDLRGRLVMRMQHAHPNGTYLGPSALDGKVRYFSHRRLSGIPIFVTAGIAYEDALAPPRARASLYYAVMGLITAASIILALLTMLSLNARQKRARALAETNRRLAEAQRVARIGDWEYDILTGVVVWSDQLCRMYERPPGQDRLTIEEFRSYLDEGDLRSLESAIAAASATGEVQSYDIQVKLPSGATSDRHIIAIPVRGPDGQVTRLYGTDQDISQDKLLHSMEEQLAYLGRQQAMSMMASTLAHELNQPLTAASNYLAGSERLVGGTDPSTTEMLNEALRSAREQVLSAGDIIRRVREMVRKETSTPELMSLGAAIESAVSLLVAAGACGKQVIERQLDPAADHVWGDSVQVRQVLVNLLRNACDAAPAERPAVCIRTAREGRYVAVRIEDNGAGFTRPPDEIFASLGSDKAQGMGFGLSISRTIVEYHEGRLWIEKTGDTGTVVAFTLPSAADESGSIGAPANSAPA